MAKWPQRTWVDGFEVTAAAFNTYVRDALADLNARADRKPFQIFLPEASKSIGFPRALQGRRNAHPCLMFEDEYKSYALWSSVLSPEYAGNNILVDLYWTSATAGTGTVVWGVQFESHTPDADDLDTAFASSFGAVTTTAVSAPTSPGILKRTTITLADGSAIDNLAAGESYQIAITREPNDDEDDMIGYAQLFRMTVFGI